MYSYSTTLAAAALLLSLLAAGVLAQSDCPPRSDCPRSVRVADDSTIQGTDCFEYSGGGELASPSENQAICYRTCISRGPGESLCMACSKRDPSLRILAPDDEEARDVYSGRAMFSPLFTRMTVDYRPSTLCRYRVQCRPKQMLHFLITDHSLQESQIIEGKSECVDFLTIFRTSSQTTSCGNFETLDPRDMEDFNEDNLRVIFRTNRRDEGSGFFIAITCVRPDFYMVDGCTSAELAQPKTGGMAGTGRRKRERENLEQVFKVREKRFSFRVPCIKVPTDAAVSYEDNTIRVYRGNVWLYKFKGIRVLQVYNRPERFLIFYGNSEGRVFPGFGFLKIGAGRAFYIQEVVEPQFRLSELELTVVRQLWSVVLADPTLLASADFDVDDELDIKPRGKYGSVGHTHTWFQGTDMVRLITSNTNACNGVVRAVACVVQEIVLNRTCEIPLPGLPMT